MGVKNTLLEQLHRMKHLMVYETGQYKPLLEDEDKPTDTSSEKVYVDKKVEFGPGYYDLKGTHTGRNKTWNWDIAPELNEELEKIKNFLQKNPTGYIVNVKLYAGESQIPNVDRTKFGPKKQIRVSPGYLSKARLNVIENYITNVLGEWKKQGIINSDVKVEKNEPVIGSTPWVGQDFCPKNRTDANKDPEGYNCSDDFNKSPNFKELIKKYTDEQYLRVVMSVDKIEGVPQEVPKDEKKETKVEIKTEGDIVPLPVTESCAAGLQIALQTKSHECNNAEYFIFANNTLLKNAYGGDTHNGNNASTKKTVDGKKLAPQALNPGYGLLGTKRYGTNGDITGTRSDVFKVTPEMSKQITSEAKDGTMKIWAICANGPKCHTDQATVVITHPKRDTNVFGPKKVNGDQILLTVLTSCGDAVVTDNSQSALSKVQPDATSAKSEYVKTRFELTQKVLSKDPKALEKATEDSKATLLQDVQDFSSISDDLVDMVERIYNEIYQKAKEKGVNKQKVKVSTPFFNKLNDPDQNLESNLKRFSKYYDKSKFKISKSNPNKSNFSLGDESFIFDDKYIRKNELTNDIRLYLTKIYTVLNQLFTADSIKNGNLEFDNSKLFGLLYDGKGLKRVRDIVADDQSSKDITDNEE